MDAPAIGLVATTSPLPPADEYARIALVTERRLPVRRAQHFWAACFAAGMALSIVLAFDQPVPVKYGFLCGILVTAAFVMVPAAMHICGTQFLAWARSAENFVVTDDPQELRRWYRSEMKFFEGSKGMLVAGGALGLVAGLSYMYGHYLDGFTTVGTIWAASLVVMSAFLAGCSLWAMGCAAAAVHGFGKAYGKRIIVTPDRFGVLSTGRMLAWCWIVIGTVWFVYTLSALFGPPYTTVAEVLGAYPVVMCAAPTFPMIVGCFIYCQLPIHDAMLEYKKRELQRIDKMLREVTPTSASAISKEARDTVDFLLKRRKETEALPDWPFNSKALAGVSSSALTAILPVLLKGLVPPEVVKQVVPSFFVG